MPESLCQLADNRPGEVAGVRYGGLRSRPAKGFTARGERRRRAAADQQRGQGARGQQQA